MDNPAVSSLMETVRKINELARRARSGEPGVEDYLRALDSDPTTKWFTELLREKSAELAKERQRADELATALRTWYRTIETEKSERSEADSQLVRVLRSMGIIDP